MRATYLGAGRHERLPVVASPSYSSAAEAARKHRSLTIAVNAPFSHTPYLGRAIENGARLAASEVNANGIRVDGVHVRPEGRDARQRSFARARGRERRRAVDDHAVAIVDEGTGVDASWRVAARGSVPIGVVFEGGDRDRRPATPAERLPDRADRSRDRLQAGRVPDPEAPEDRDRRRTTRTTAQRGRPRCARRSPRTDRRSPLEETVPVDALDLRPQLLRARRAGATARARLGAPGRRSPRRSPRPARGLGRARSSRRRPAPTRSSASSSRTTRLGRRAHLHGRPADRRGRHGAVPHVRAEAQAASGVDRVGVKTRAGRRGDPAARDSDVRLRLRQPRRCGDPAGPASADPAKVTAALEQVSIEGANGDSRGFNQRNHEGVVDDDVYFARFHDMTYAPVRDDPLSSTLPDVPQTR